MQTVLLQMQPNSHMGAASSHKGYAELLLVGIGSTDFIIDCIIASSFPIIKKGSLLTSIKTNLFKKGGYYPWYQTLYKRKLSLRESGIQDRWLWTVCDF